MNDEHSPIVVENEDNLEEPPTMALAPDEPLLILATKWEWGRCVLHDPLGLFDSDAMCCDVLNVPVIPTKVQSINLELLI